MEWGRRKVTAISTEELSMGCFVKRYVACMKTIFIHRRTEAIMTVISWNSSVQSVELLLHQKNVFRLMFLFIRRKNWRLLPIIMNW